MGKELPKQRTRFRKDRPYKWYFVTSYGDSGYCYTTKGLKQTVAMYRARDRQVAVYRLQKIKQPYTGDKSLVPNEGQTHG